MKTASALLAALLLCSPPSCANPIFELDFLPGTSLQAQQGYYAAAARWSALLQDNVTIRLTVGTAALGPGIIGQTGSAASFYDYASVRGALLADATSAADLRATASLAPGAIRMLVNRTSDNPNGAGGAAPYLDANDSLNNNVIYLHDAEAKALGLHPAAQQLAGCLSSCDGYIEFNSDLAFDYDASNGIGAGALDFVGAATHEIGHALGFFSGVDILDYNSPPLNAGPFPEDAFIFVTVLDLFRYSADSAALGAIDWSADARDKYFSIDGGATAGPQLSTGVTYGDGSQASHWKDSLGTGIMDPTAGYGELLGISANDLLALDVIGWDVLQVAAVPVPGSLGLMLPGLLYLAQRRNSPLTALRASFKMRAF